MYEAHLIDLHMINTNPFIIILRVMDILEKKNYCEIKKSIILQKLFNFTMNVAGFLLCNIQNNYLVVKLVSVTDMRLLSGI